MPTLNILFMILISFFEVCGFNSLQEVRHYAESHQEYPEPTTLNWTNPRYTSFYYENKPSYLQKMSHFFGITQSDWNINDFYQIVNRRLARSAQAQQKQTMITRIDLSTNPTLYVWGDLRGSFHSLSRALDFLEKEGIIDNNLKIIKPDCFFVFNGNVIDGSAYSLETLTLVLTLLEINNDHVIYLAGKHEYHSYWKNFDTKHQLIIYGNLVSKKKRQESIHLLTKLFKTLPLALYGINTKTADQSAALRISYFSQSTPLLNESLMGKFFTDPQESPLLYYPIDQKNKSLYQPFIKAEVRSSQWRHDHRIHNGLECMDQDKGATAWSVLSCPTTAYQIFNNFYYDAFAKISCNEMLEKSTITLCRRDIRKKEALIYQTPYNLCSGVPTTNPLHYTGKDDIIFGASIPLIQGIPIMGQRTLRGVMVRLSQENSTGGVNGHIIRVIAENDNYNPSTALTNVHNFLEKNIDIILFSIGAPTIESYLDLIKEKKILALFPMSGGIEYRDPSLTNMVHFRCSYKDEVTELIEYAYKEWNSRKFALFYQDDSYGQSPKDATHELLAQKNCTIVDVPYIRATTNLNKQAEIISDAEVDTIAFYSISKTTIELVRAIGIENIANKKLLGISFFAGETYRNFSSRYNISTLFSAVVPNPFVSTLAIVNEYRAAMDKAGYTYDVDSLESYIGTSILIEVLKNMDAPYTKEKIYNALITIKDMDLKGLKLSYNPNNHTLYDTVYLEMGNNNPWIEKKIRTNNKEINDLYQKIN